MKLNLPLMIGAVVVAAALGALLLWKPEPTPQQLAQASVERVRADLQKSGKSEGRDYVIETPVIVNRSEDEMIVRIDVKLATGEANREYHRLVLADSGWEFSLDLWKSFKAFVETEKAAACERLAKKLLERYQESINIPADKVRIASRLRESTPYGSTETKVIGSIHIQFLDGPGEGRYVEDFVLVKGAWTMDGPSGQLFDRGPRTPPQGQ